MRTNFFDTKVVSKSGISLTKNIAWSSGKKLTWTERGMHEPIEDILERTLHGSLLYTCKCIFRNHYHLKIIEPHKQPARKN